MSMKVTADSVRRTLRTGLQVFVALVLAVPVLVQAGVIDPAAAPWLGTVVALAAAVARFTATDRGDALVKSLLGEPFARDAAPGDEDIAP